MIAAGFTQTAPSFGHAEGIPLSPSARVFVQPWLRSQQFNLPADPTTPLIMVGGDLSGLPTFHGLLEQRKATDATGEHWLLLCDRQAAGTATEAFFHDAVVYDCLRDGTLSRFDAPLPGEREDGLGIHRRLFDHARGLWAWIDLGASLYVCGNATQLARIDTALADLIAGQGRMCDDHATDYLAEMARERRYQQSLN